MHEKDQLDQMLESSLSSYGDPGTDTRLAERILARVSNEKIERERVRMAQPPPSAVDCSSGGGLLAVESSCMEDLEAVGDPPFDSSTEHCVCDTQEPSSEHCKCHACEEDADSHCLSNNVPACMPPLSDLLLDRSLMCSRNPSRFRLKSRLSTLLQHRFLKSNVEPLWPALKNDDAPLNIAAISIQPLEVADTGKN